MKHLTPQEFDQIHRKKTEEELAAHPDEEGGYVIGCLFDLYYPDNKTTECSNCGIPLFIRPWLLKLAQEHHLTVVCQFCVDPQEFRGKIIQDLAKVVVETGEK